MIKIRFMTFLEQHKFLSQNQYGFKSGIGTEEALYCATNYITNSLNNGEKSLTIFLDLAKAFDLVN